MIRSVTARWSARVAGVDPQVLSRAFLGVVLLCLGYPDQALAWSSAAIARRPAAGAHSPSLASALAIGAGLPSAEITALGERADELVAITTEQGFPAWRAQGTIYRGYAKVKIGDVVKGVTLLRGGLSAYRTTGTETWMPHLIALFAEACRIAGQIEEGLTLLDDALQTVERTREHWFEAELNRQKGQLLLRQGHTEAAEKLYRKALSIAVGAVAPELRRDEPGAAVGRAGRRAEWPTCWLPVYVWFTGGSTRPTWKEAVAARRLA